MKKAFDQTVRDLKREVNKKVLKVPGIEQKVLDATSNEPWGPHGSNLADIAQATRNYQEFQMIMTVIWKRINDTGKNWRHVYKALTVLEYLVAHGSERVIDEIKEHAYQLSTLSDFQYIDSSGRDQGSNVRRKSQSLVALVNDKERVHEVRQKALANKDKYRSTFSTGGMHRHGSHSSGGGYGDQYDDDRYEGRYGSRDDERNGYGRERDWANRDDERYGRTGDTYNRDGDRYGRDTDERFGKENYRDGDYRGRGNDDDQYGAKNRSIDRDMGKSYEEDDHYSSRSSGGKADGFSQNERHLEHKLSDTTSAPPSYEEAIKDTQNHINDERDGRSAPAPVQKASSPLAPKAASSAGSTTQDPDHIKFVATPKNDTDGFDEFDPRGSASAVQPAASTPSLDFFGSFSASDPANSSALVPVASATATSGPDVASNSGMGMNFVASTTACAGSGQPVEDPFGDSPFKATPHENLPAQPQSSIASGSYNPGSIGCTQPTAAFASADTKSETAPSFNFEDTLGGITYTSSIPNSQHSSGNPATQSLELPGSQATNDILDAFLSPAGSVNLSPLPVHPVGLTHVQTTQVNLPQAVVSASLAPPAFPVPSQMAQPATPVPTNVQTFPSLIPQSSAMVAGYASQAAPISAGPTIKTHPSKDKLELKSTVWADTLSRGLVDLNISGSKTNPLADIGIDFDSINRMEKRKEAKSSAAPVTSTITMGKPMGTGTGSGRAGASGLAPPPNPMMGSSMGMGMGMGMGGYGGNMNQPMGMGMGMNMGMVGRPPMGMPPPGPGMAGGGYNPMMGMGNYGPQQPYGGGYR